MPEEGEYLYCIIENSNARNFGPIGIGDWGSGVTTIPCGDLSAVVSSIPMSKYVVSRETMTAHEKVLEEVMKDCTLLPVRFYTVAPSVDEIRSLLRRRHAEFKNLLRYLDNRIELGLKALWKDMNLIFQEIIGESAELKALQQKILSISSGEAEADGKALTAGVKSRLQEKKDKETEGLLDPLKKISVDVRYNKTHGDDMICNAALLVDRRWEKEFDIRVEELTKANDNRIRFIYVGPVPPYSFVNIMVRE